MMTTQFAHTVGDKEADGERGDKQLLALLLAYGADPNIRKPLLLASEIQGLPDLTGYFCQRPCDGETGLHVVKVRLPYQAPVKRHPAPIERAIPTWDRGVVSETTLAEPLDADSW